MWRYLVLILTSLSFAPVEGQKGTISGFVTEQGSGEFLPGVNIFLSPSGKGTVSNTYGFYSIDVDKNTDIEIVFSSLGYKRFVRQMTDKLGRLDVALLPDTRELEEIVVIDQPGLLATQNFTRLGPEQIRVTPVLLGEKDVLKTIQLLPGVQRGIEGSTSFFVRGGRADQNLFIMDDAIMYNPNHLFGFLSNFNTAAIKDVRFYKGTFPARFGGRLSSVTTIQIKDGDKSNNHVEGGVGLLSGRLSVEGPLSEGRSSYFLSARRSFIDLLVRPFQSSSNRDTYRFFDTNLKLNFELDSNNSLFLSGYLGGDKLRTIELIERTSSSIESSTNLGWENAGVSVRWNRAFSDKLFNNLTGSFSTYNFGFADTYKRTGLNANYTRSDFSSKVYDISIRNSVDFFINSEHLLRLGSQFTRRYFSPRIFYTVDQAVGTENNVRQRLQTDEFTAYLEDEWTIASGVTADLGVRYSLVSSRPNQFSVVEPRIHIFWEVTRGLVVNGGYTRANQFMHLLSNTGLGLPTDLWVPATSQVPPQQGDLFSIGLAKDFSGKYEISIESYRRNSKNIITYRQDSEFLDVGELSKEIRWEDNIAIGEGEAYGTEILLEKRKGRFNGRIGYTLAWAIDQFNEVNGGQRYFPNYDSRHNAVLALSYRISDRVEFSASWIYSSATAMTAPQGYYFANFADGLGRVGVITSSGITSRPITEQIQPVPYFGSLNSYRGQDYHRMDLSIVLKRMKKKSERFWEFGVFNAYNRKNALYYYLEASNDSVNGGQRYELKKKTLFPILPSISYNFKF